jgi:hypothetical protein
MGKYHAVDYIVIGMLISLLSDGVIITVVEIIL